MMQLPSDADLDPWTGALTEARTRMRPLFRQARVADSAAAFVETALVGRGRRTGWMRATRAGDAGPWRQQALLGRARWCADALRDAVRDFVLDHIGSEDGVLSVCEVAFLKQGDDSCGVARQRIGPRSRIANCQVGIVLAYASEAGTALVDRGLYLPPAWSADRERLAKAGVPDGEPVAASRAQLTARLVGRSLASGSAAAFVTTPVEFFADLVPLARQAGCGLMAPIDAAAVVGSPLGRPHIHGSASDIARRLPFSAWHRDSSDTQHRDDDAWAICELAVADGDAVPPQRRRGLLVCRAGRGGLLRFYRSEHPAGTSRDMLVAAARRAQAADAMLRVARADHGFDHNETRSWHGWHRHVTLVMMALAVRAAALGTATSTRGQPAEPRTISSMVGS